MGCDGMGWDGNYPYYPNYRLFLERPHHDRWSWIWMATTITTLSTIYISERLHPHPWSWIWWQLPLLPQLPSVFRETPPTLSVYCMRMVYNMGIDSHWINCFKLVSGIHNTFRPLLSSPPTFWRVHISLSKIRHFIHTEHPLPPDCIESRQTCVVDAHEEPSTPSPRL